MIQVLLHKSKSKTDNLLAWLFQHSLSKAQKDQFICSFLEPSNPTCELTQNLRVTVLCDLFSVIRLWKFGSDSRKWLLYFLLGYVLNVQLSVGLDAAWILTECTTYVDSSKPQPYTSVQIWKLLSHVQTSAWKIPLLTFLLLAEHSLALLRKLFVSIVTFSRSESDPFYPYLFPSVGFQARHSRLLAV